MKILGLFLFIILSLNVYAQNVAMDMVNYPKSILSMGLGQNSTAFPDNDGALIYNPANLVYINNLEVSFYHRQFAILSSQYPLNTFSAYFNLSGIGSFGIEYNNHNYGKLAYTSVSSPNGESIYNESYERSFSAGYARRFSDEFAAGIQLRYSWSKMAVTEADHFFVSAGLNYNPAFLAKKVNIGFALTNFSDNIDIKSEYINFSRSAASPSKLNFALNYTPFNNLYFSTGIHLAMSKYLATNTTVNNRDVKPSFVELFNDWKVFPRDVDLHTGLYFNWKPLDIGKNFSFFQNIYLGNEASGIEDYNGSSFTHGIEFGVQYSAFKLSAGYTGIWHQVPQPDPQFRRFPIESFQFTFGMNESILNGKIDDSRSAGLNKIILSLGLGLSRRFGRYEEIARNKTFNDIYYLEGGFYINENSALISSINYSAIPHALYYSSEAKMQYDYYDTFIITSQFRYHPFDTALPYYVQGGLGIMRYNSHISYRMKYEYKPTLHLALGGLIELPVQFVINPEINYMLLFDRFGSSAPYLGGFNQFDLIVKLGYRF